MVDDNLDPLSAAEDRRRFLKSCGRFAVTVPPAMTMVLSTSLSSPAIAKSAGGGGGGNVGGGSGGEIGGGVKAPGPRDTGTVRGQDGGFTTPILDKRDVGHKPGDRGH